MKKMITWILNHKKIMLILYGVILISSFVMSKGVETNYNLAEYLPEEMGSKQALDILGEEFGNHGMTNLLIKDKSIPEILDLKEKIRNIDGVDKVIWLDDVVDLKVSLGFHDQSIVEGYYKDNHAYMQIIFVEDDYGRTTSQAIKDIESLVDGFGGSSGPATSANAMVSSVGTSIKTAMMVVVPMIILLLILSTNSYFEVILFLITIGIAILINSGTNIFLGEISFITASASSLLQLAIAMDYSIFLLHRLGEERKAGKPLKEAMISSVTASFSTIAASSITTIAGFLALTLMSFGIGFDLGIVLAKGIFISLVCVITFLPVATVYSHKLIEKTSHREFLPSFRGVATFFEKGRFIILGLIILITIPAFLGQKENKYIYGSGSQVSEAVRETEASISQVFGGKNTVVVLVDKQSPTKELELVKALKSIDKIDSVTGLYSIIDPTLPLTFVPEEVTSNFISENYSRYLINMNTPSESEEAFIVYENLLETVYMYYPKAYITGETPSTYDTKAVSEKDYSIVTFVSIAAVGIILLITFKSFLLPILLLAVIEISIWINMSIPYFTGSEMVYLGFLIVSALQLGATIDYAILLTNRYVENRKTMKKEKASIEAVTAAGHSIFTSSTILGVCGLAIGFLFEQATLKSMGMLVGRGALLSGFIVFTILPQILLFLDPIIKKTTYKYTTVEDLERKKK